MPVTPLGSRPDLPDASLLWAKRLTIHNAALLERMDKFESKLLLNDERTLKAEQAANTCNTVVQEVRVIKQVLDDFIDSPEEKQRDEALSNLLGEHTITLTTLRDRMDKLASDYRSRKSELENLVVKHDANERKLHEVGIKIKELQHVQTRNPEPDLLTRLSQRLIVLEARESQWDQLIIEFEHMENKVSSLEATCNEQRMVLTRLRNEQAREDSNRGKEKPQNLGSPVIQVPRSPEPEQSSSYGRHSPSHQTLPKKLTESDVGIHSGQQERKKKSINPRPITYLSEQNAQVPDWYDTQMLTQTTTQLYGRDSHDFDLTSNDSELVRSNASHPKESSSSKRRKLSFETQSTRTQEKPPPQPPKHALSNNLGVTVLCYTPRNPNFIISTSVEEPIPKNAAQTSCKQKGLVKKTVARKKGGVSNHITEESQTTRFLRSALRKQGCENSPTDTLQELGYDNTPRAQPMLRRRTPGVLTSQMLATPASKKGVLSANINANGDTIAAPMKTNTVSKEVIPPKKSSTVVRTIPSPKKPGTATKAIASRKKAAIVSKGSISSRKTVLVSEGTDLKTSKTDKSGTKKPQTRSRRKRPLYDYYEGSEGEKYEDSSSCI